MRTILRILHWVLFLLIALIIVVFVVQNRHVVEVSLWPFPFMQQAPLFAVIVLCVLFGFLVGVISAWLSGAGTRKKARDLARLRNEKLREINELQKELAAYRGAAPTPPRPGITHAA
jgi:uncharacterized integral membrane protein